MQCQEQLCTTTVVVQKEKMIHKECERYEELLLFSVAGKEPGKIL